MKRRIDQLSHLHLLANTASLQVDPPTWLPTERFPEGLLGLQEVAKLLAELPASAQKKKATETEAKKKTQAEEEGQGKQRRLVRGGAEKFKELLWYGGSAAGPAPVTQTS